MVQIHLGPLDVSPGQDRSYLSDDRLEGTAIDK
jgi:hypothetical protein